MAEPTTEPVRGGTGIDVAFGLVFAVLATAALVWLIPSQVSTQAGGTDVSPAFMPRLAAGTVLVLSLGLVGHRLARGRLSGGARDGGRLLAETAALGAGGVAVMAGLATVGFLPTAMGLILAAGLAARQRPRWWLLVLAVAFPVIVDLGAWHLFVVDLP